MLMSTEDARHKWCPYVRIDGNNRFNSSMNEGYQRNHGPYHCLGEECMMWRRVHLHMMKGHAQSSATSHGYCGLAGKPDLD